jgi:hypothetical protein
MRVQFVAVVIVGLILIPVGVFGSTCPPPTALVKTASELRAWNRADTVFEGKVESVELGWKWSTRKARVEVVGDMTHIALELIAN